MNSAGLANLPVVTAAGHAVIVCENEIMWVTAHTAAATSATILRAQEGTSPASHALNIAWVHGPVASDYDSVLGYAQVVANQTPITVEADLTSLTLTVTVPYAGHRIRVSGQTNVQSSTVDDVAALIIQQDGVQVAQQNVLCRPVNWAIGLRAEAVFVPTAASHTYKLRMKRDTGAGNLTMVAGATFPAFILVEDLGPAL